ncbi:hypothetical protein CKO08_00830 [Halorhodospira halochloris]|nr:hypothetical protein [Halorhodospira halochloris]
MSKTLSNETARRINMNIDGTIDRAKFCTEINTDIISCIIGALLSSSNIEHNGWTLELIKSSKSYVYRWRDHSGHDFIIKLYSPTGPKERIKSFLRPPKYLFATAEKLIAAGVSTPKPIAAFRLTTNERAVGIYIMEREEGITVKDLAKTSVCLNTGLHIAAEMGRAWGNLVRSGFLHMDPIRGNFLYGVNHRGHHSLTVLDIDNIYFIGWLPKPVRLHRLKKMSRIHLLGLPKLIGTTPPRLIFKRFLHAYAKAYGVPVKIASREWIEVISMLAKQKPDVYTILSNFPIANDNK